MQLIQRGYQRLFCTFGYPFFPYTYVHIQFAEATGGSCYSGYRDQITVRTSLLDSWWDFSLGRVLTCIIQHTCSESDFWAWGHMTHGPHLTWLVAVALAWHISSHQSPRTCLHIIHPCGYLFGTYSYIFTLCIINPLGSWHTYSLSNLYFMSSLMIMLWCIIRKGLLEPRRGQHYPFLTFFSCVMLSMSLCARRGTSCLPRCTRAGVISYVMSLLITWGWVA